jgi:ArsR family transcriptional regulator, arsenate/arsenite/antimonite-responsive transcriptional repressor
MDPAPGTAVPVFSALGHEVRLTLFRLLVRAGGEGLNIGEITRQMGLAPSTLSHHLATLVEAGLVRQERRGREVLNHANLSALRELMGFLDAECCVSLAERAA